jgi:hypothetical protein
MPARSILRGSRQALAQPTRDIIMRPETLHLDRAGLSDRLGDANAVTPKLMSDLVATACRRFPSFGASETTARIKDLIQHRAWTDAALALVDLELPLWQVRRIAYDEGEWYCALSRERELPDWLDRSVEARHTDLALAILSAFIEAQRISSPSIQTSVPTVTPSDVLYERVNPDHFG